MVASAMDSPSCGMRMGMRMGRGESEGEQFAEGGGDGGCGRSVIGPEVRVIGDRGVAGVEAAGRGVEEVEAVGDDAADDFGADSAPWEAFGDGEESAGAGDGGEDGVGVEGFDAAEVDDFDFPAVVEEVVGGAEAFVEHGAAGDDGGVAAAAGDSGFADGESFCGQGVGLEVIVEELVFAEDDGVVEGDGVEEHGVGVADGGGGEDDEAGVVGVEAFHALAVERAAAAGAAAGEADDERAGDAGAPEVGGGLIDDLVEADAGEVGELHFDDGAHAADGSADGHADHGVFADGAVEDAAGEVAREVLGGFEGAAEGGDVLAVDEHGRVVAQGLGLSFADGFQISDAHVASPSPRGRLRFKPEKRAAAGEWRAGECGWRVGRGRGKGMGGRGMG